MATYGFSDRNVAKRLKQMAAGVRIGPQADRYSELLYFKTPVGGIPAKSGTTWGKATCTLYHPSYDGTDVDEEVAQDTSGSDITATVFNWAPVAITAETFVWVGYAGELLVVLNEACS
ncbi:hypothetical protein [Planctomycetes bacterium TBK1r]|uniref:Uncharacterized protein n=1 Tax=Stieleria magnilauensis TaxID=2527963 RepID=A0ABX5XZH0_9BACT|nr:hypothetical protein TBK1r_59390 [Planctomycetes bacterium TBK1r]QDV86990.1 hypothetical protein TBK1r_60170 [Planctomycetes bacterium TBK1r]